jgi:hypothetical protein
MTTLQVSRAIDLLALAFALGATAWFFFVQSPVLLKAMGRDKFVPLQMRLVVVLFKALTVALALAFLASFGHSEPLSHSVCSAGLALAAGLFNRFVILPKAMRAGGQSRAEIKGRDHEGTTAAFVSDGAGDRTKVLHRLVVVFVVVMTLGLVVHGFLLTAA